MQFLDLLPRPVRASGLGRLTVPDQAVSDKAGGYVYHEIGCDSGSGDRVGGFKPCVVGVGPQVGFIIPIERHGAAG
ncbi:MAG: hypothetical protein WAN75_20325 [Xanthobacteraceae bacterium]